MLQLLEDVEKTLKTDRLWKIVKRMVTRSDLGCYIEKGVKKEEKGVGLQPTRFYSIRVS